MKKAARSVTLKPKRTAAKSRTTPKASRQTPKRAAVVKRTVRPVHGALLSILLLVLSVFVFVQHQEVVDVAAGPPSAPTGKIWQQVWNDEFNGNSVDAAKWNVQNSSNYGGGNNEDQCYMANNVAVSGGALRLTGKRETVTCGANNPDTGNSTYYFTSGMVTGRAQGGALKYKFKQGYAEARMKAPKGNPYWPAFWLVSPNDGSTPGWPDYGEFDITEMYGARPDITNGSLHYKCTKAGNHCQLNPTWYNLKTDSAYGGTSTLGTQISTQAAMDAYTGGTTDYNTYGMLWEADKLTWYTNGRKTRYFDGTNLYRIEQNGSQTLEGTTATLGTPSIPFSTVFGYDHSINLNLAIGGNGPRYSYYGYTGIENASGYTDGNLVMQDPGTLEVDYVRVYQLADQPVQTPTPPAPSTPTPVPVAPTPPATTVTSNGSAGNNKSTTIALTVVDAQTGEKVAVVANNDTVQGNAVLSPELVTDKEVQAKVSKVEYYVDGMLQQTAIAPPYQFNTKSIANGTYRVKEKVYYKDGTTQEKTVTIAVQNTAAKKTDAATSGLPWTGVIGSVIVAGILGLGMYIALPAGRGLPARILRRFIR